ncbi:unnamed protein product [Onchocerca flexuosa]|uniref:Bm10925 n=1 Tax=Onchocerca flexuosa TaxID=387005 RepID=A0A183GZL2_9BILA|nr:unnamed protein product [Onchocerca flexuosa]
MGAPMKASRIFRLSQTNIQNLSDFVHFTSAPILLLLDTGTRFVIDMLPSSLHFTSSYEISRKISIDSRIPNGSLLSLRTFYAFGARSGRTPLLQRSLSHSVYYKSSLYQSTETNITLQHSSTAFSMHGPKRSITCHNRYHFAPFSNLCKLYSNSTVNNYRFSINTRSSYHTGNDTGLQRCEQSVNVAAIPEMKNEMLKPQEDSAEMIALTEKNKSLEEEVKRLTSRLKEKEQSEREFRRKLLEYAAEIKVWKKKYEMQKQIATIEISESKGNKEEINDIMEQLKDAAEKLTRLDAVKDLKLLQSEMETALKEISK